MDTFKHSRDAVDFLVSKVAAEADSEGAPLSEIERKMLYFSETAPTLPDIVELNDAFDRDYNSDDYEKRIAGLIGTAKQRLRKSDKQMLEAWSDAIRALRKEDCYLLVMIDRAGASVRPRGDLLNYFFGPR